MYVCDVLTSERAWAIIISKSDKALKVARFLHWHWYQTLTLFVNHKSVIYLGPPARLPPMVSTTPAMVLKPHWVLQRVLHPVKLKPHVIRDRGLVPSPRHSESCWPHWAPQVSKQLQTAPQAVLQIVAWVEHSPPRRPVSSQACWANPHCPLQVSVQGLALAL